ncbi:hypothetical protein N7501_000790 [Penicillium viridicatum]|nr:hypothetical protein N7501_000790 [Penicillium viridicatum]
MKLTTTIIGLTLVQLGSCLAPISKGHYSVPGLGTSKQALLNAGDTTKDMAIAMAETEDFKANYPLGDGKTEDAAVFGIFKQNWYTLRINAESFAGQSAADYLSGAVLNDDLKKEVKAPHDAESSLGFDTWAAAQRNAAYGIKNPNTQDIQNYKDTIEWIQSQIDSDFKYQTDDTRFRVGVTA